MHRYLIGCVLWLLLSASTGFAREGFVEVTHQDLLNYPQKYWSQSIIFQDELLEAPKGPSMTIASKRYQLLKTANLGECYAEEDLVPELKRSELNARYLFQGTVLHQPSSFFSRNPSFYVVVQKISREVDAVAQVQNVFNDEQKNLSPGSDAIMKRVQQDLIAFARKNNLQMSDLFAPGYTNQVMVHNVIYSSVSAVEQQYNTSARKLLGDFVAEVFQSEFGAPERVSVNETLPEATPSAVVATTPPDAVEISTPPETVTTETPSKMVEEDRMPSLRQRATILLKPGIRPSTPKTEPTPEAEPTAEPITPETP